MIRVLRRPVWPLPWRTILARLRWRRRAPPAPLQEVVQGPLGLAGVLFEQPGIALVAVDRNGRVLRANAAMRAITAADVSVGAPVLALFAPGERDAVWAELTAALHGQPPRSLLATTLQSGAGREPAVGLSCLKLRDREGRPSGVLLRLSDLSAQRQLEWQLAQAQKLQALGQLAGGIAHDFNNLLTAVQNAAEALAERGDLPGEAAEDVAQVRASAGRGAALVRQLLAFGRQQTLQPLVLSLNAAVIDLSGLLTRLVGSQIRLDLELEEPTCTVRADPTQLDQVLVNLAVNARDAMPEGGTLTVRTGHVTLHRAETRGAEPVPPGRYATVEVADTGTGIPAEILSRIFDPFFTTRREQGGSGLGLSTVHGIVRQSDGFVEVQSEPGVGTRVRVHLPRCEDSVAIPVPPAAGGGLPPRVGVAPGRVQGLVLLVDDEEPVRRLAERALSRAGWTVLSAESGDAALALLATGAEMRLVGIVTDMAMHGMDGVAVVRAVRRHTGQTGLPALLVSGYAEASLRAALAGESQVSFLPKPYALRELTDAFSALVTNSEPLH